MQSRHHRRQGVDELFDGQKSLLGDPERNGVGSDGRKPDEQLHNHRVRAESNESRKRDEHLRDAQPHRRPEVDQRHRDM